MLELFRIFMSLSFAATVTELVAILAGVGFVYDYGYRHEWWGVPSRLVEVRDFQMIDEDNFQNRYPRISGVLVNNSEKTLTKYEIRVAYYRCSDNDDGKNDIEGCNQVWPDGVAENTYQVVLGIGPHTRAYFEEIHSMHDIWRVRILHERPGYYIKIVPSVVHVSD